MLEEREFKHQLAYTLQKLKDIEFALNESTIVAFTNEKGIITDVNPAFCRISQYSREELIGQDHRILNSGYHPRSFFREMWKIILSGQVWEGEVRNRAKDGTFYWVKTTIVPFLNEEGRPYQFVSIRTDISEQKKVKEQLEYLVHTDPLTNLPNRRFFEEKLREMLAQARLKNEKLAVLYLDLDRFKYVNDILGHAMGDKILQLFASLLLEARTPKDFIARLGGDEFTLLSPGIQDRNEVVHMAKKLIQMLDKPFMIDDYELFIQTSIGISFFPDDGEDDQTIMKYADAALHRAKAEGRNKYRIYNPSFFSETKKTFAIEKELRLAVQKGEFHLHYQPKVDSITGKILGAEALLRWNHSQWGMISPADFIPLAEDTGIIFPIGEWVMQTACRQSNEWRDQGLPIVPISINVSAKSFMHRDFATIFQKHLEQLGTSSTQIEVEITESCLLHNPEEIQITIQKLKAMGVRIALDDFGTGYSSLSYLKKFDMDTLKIDRSFIQDLDDPKVHTITTSIIQIAKGLNMKIVAEGVETHEQLRFLQAHQCEEIQGYLCSRPVSAEEFARMLEMEVCLL